MPKTKSRPCAASRPAAETRRRPDSAAAGTRQRRVAPGCAASWSRADEVPPGNRRLRARLGSAEAVVQADRAGPEAGGLRRRSDRDSPARFLLQRHLHPVGGKLEHRCDIVSDSYRERLAEVLFVSEPAQVQLERLRLDAE